MAKFVKSVIFAICVSHSTYLIAETLYYENAIYVGDVINGKPHGQGSIEFTNGYKYEGGWFLGTKKGVGTATYASGHIYEGEWLNGERHGQGTRTSPNGHIYEGEWLNGKEHGQGTYTWPNGQKYVGGWRNGEYHGQGTMFMASGRQKSGEYQYGEYVGGILSGLGQSSKDVSINESGRLVGSIGKTNVIWFLVLAMLAAGNLYIVYGPANKGTEMQSTMWTLIKVFSVVPSAALLGAFSISVSEGYPFDPMEVASGKTLFPIFLIWPFALGYLLLKRSKRSTG
jgi:hypothetical protein